MSYSGNGYAGVGSPGPPGSPGSPGAPGAQGATGATGSSGGGGFSGMTANQFAIASTATTGTSSPNLYVQTHLGSVIELIVTAPEVLLYGNQIALASPGSSLLFQMGYGSTQLVLLDSTVNVLKVNQNAYFQTPSDNTTAYVFFNASGTPQLTLDTQNDITTLTGILNGNAITAGGTLTSNTQLSIQDPNALGTFINAVTNDNNNILIVKQLGGPGTVVYQYFCPGDYDGPFFNVCNQIGSNIFQIDSSLNQANCSVSFIPTDTAGGFDVGSASNYWGNGYFGNVETYTIGSLSTIGVQAYLVGTASIQIGTNSTPGAFGQCYATSWNNTSDRKLKKNIRPCVLGLEFINKLKTSTYETVHEPQKGKTYHGFVAQDIEKIVSSSEFGGLTLPDPKDPNSVYAVDYTQLIAPLVKSIQELTLKFNALKRKTEAQDIKILNLEKKLENHSTAHNDLLRSVEVMPPHDEGYDLLEDE